MKVLFICTLCLIGVDAVVSMKVTGYSGGGVLIKCKYDTAYKSNPKYFCKGNFWVFCADQIKTGAAEELRDKRRFSLFDEKNSSAFRVLITKLTVKDSGTYRCGIQKDLEKDHYSKVEVTVMDDESHEKVINKTVRVGANMNVTCKFPKTHLGYPKFFCRKSPTGGCTYKAAVKGSREWVEDERFLLHDDKAKQNFNVTMKNVTQWHAGEYWCGAEASWESDHGYKVYITQINLNVAGVRDLASSPLTSSTKRTRTTERPKGRTSSRPSHRASTVSLSVSSPPSSSTSSSSSHADSASELGLTFSSAEFPASTVITVSVLLLSLLIGTSFLIVVLRKRLKMKAAACVHTYSDPRAGTNHEAPPAVNDYEEIKDGRCIFAPTANTYSTVYSTLQPSTNVQSAETHGDASNTIYATAQLPLQSSSSSASHDKQSDRSPPDGPVYASVRIHTSSSNGEGPQVVFKKEERSCDYSTVSR